jgi:hypothetical protein
MAVRCRSGLKIEYFFHPLFLSLGLISLINRYALRYTGVPFFDYYLNDLIAVPVTLYLSSIILGFIYGLMPFPISNLRIIISVLLFSITFELIMPLLSNDFTSDSYDFAAYAAGGLIYYIIERPASGIR